MDTSDERPADVYDLVDRVLALSAATFGAIGGTLQRLQLTEALANLLWQLDPAQPAPSMKEIAGLLYCDPSTVTFLVAKLENAGLATREPGPRDRRSKVVVLTGEGRARRAALVHDIVSQSPLGNLTPRERQRLLQLVWKALPRAGSNPDAPACVEP